MRIRPEKLMTAQEIVAKTLVDNDIEVRWTADRAWADLDKRIIYLRPMPEEISAVEMLHVRADTDHELAHLLFTDVEAWGRLDEEERPLQWLLSNSLEDGRIERLLGEEYLGCSQNLEASNAQILDNVKQRARSTLLSRRTRVVVALHFLAYGRSRSWAEEALGADIAPFLDLLGPFLDEIQEVATTNKVIDLAERIQATWEWTSESLDKTAGEKTPEHNPVHEKRLAKKILARTVVETRRKKVTKYKFVRSNVYRPFTKYDKVEIVPRPSAPEDRYDQAQVDFFRQVRAIAPPLRRRLLMEFRGPGPREARFQRRGKPDSKALWKIGVGSDRVFKNKVIDLVIDRAITLMIDTSASMLSHEKPHRASRLFIAAQVACANSLVLDLLGVPNEVLAWTTGPHGIERPGFERTTPLRHLIVKEFGDSFRKVRHRFLDLACLADPIENVDGESLRWGAQRLATYSRHSGKRPLLIVLSDGDPLSHPEDPGLLAWHLKRTTDRIRSAGIPLLGVGIQSDHVTNYYSRSVVVNDLSDLVADYYVLLRQILRESLVPA